MLRLACSVILLLSVYGQDGEYLDEMIAKAKKTIPDPLRMPNAKYQLQVPLGMVVIPIELNVLDVKVKGLKGIQRFGKPVFYNGESGIATNVTLGTNSLTVDGKFIIRRLIPLVRVNVDARVRLRNVRTKMSFQIDDDTGRPMVNDVKMEPIEDVRVAVKNWGVLNPLASAFGEIAVKREGQRVRRIVAKGVLRMLNDRLAKLPAEL